MANRNFNRKQALDREVKELFADISIGASGAPTLSRGLGVASVAKTATGEYTITLQDKYSRLMHASASVMSASAEDVHAQLQSESVASAKTLVIRTQKADLTLVNPASGDRILVKIDVKNSSI